MTEIALNELIAGLPGNDPAADRRNGKARRAARRACGDIPVKGNYYRRLLDLWWTLT